MNGPDFIESPTLLYIHQYEDGISRFKPNISFFKFEKNTFLIREMSLPKRQMYKHVFMTKKEKVTFATLIKNGESYGTVRQEYLRTVPDRPGYETRQKSI